MSQAARNEVAVITGASTGIGRALASRFAENGFDLVLCSDEEEIHAAARSLAAQGVDVLPVQADLATFDGCETLYRRATEWKSRPIEAVALNAGIGTSGDFSRETDLDRELKIIQLNVVGTVHLAKLFSRDMVARGRGRILVTSSIAGIMPAPLMTVYGATKAFGLSFAASLRHELEGTGVTVTALTPGPTDTHFFERAEMEETKVAAKDAKKNDPEDVARQAFDALMAGKDRVVGASTLSTKLQGAAARFMPEKLKAKMHERMAQPTKSNR